MSDAAMKAAEGEAQARVSSQAILPLIVTFRWFCDRLLVITGGGRGCAEDEDARRNKKPQSVSTQAIYPLLEIYGPNLTGCL